MRYKLIESLNIEGRYLVLVKETVAFANEPYAHFQSTLDMLGGMYDSVDINAAYRPN